MNNIRYLLLICILSIGYAQTNIYNSIIKSSVSGAVADIQYSPDQKYVALAMNSRIVLYEGVTAYPKYYVDYGTIFAFSSFAFSQNSDTYAVGFSAGDGSRIVKIYRIFPAEEILTIQEAGRENVVLTINSICFTADNARLIFSTSEGLIYSYRFSDNSTKNIKFGDVPASTIACSPTNSLQFAAAGSSPADGRQSKFKLYNINAVTNQIEEAHDFLLTDPDETLGGITYSASGAYLYRSGTNRVYKNNVNTYAEETVIPLTAGLKDFMKVRVSKNDDVIAVSTKSKKLYIVKFLPGSSNAQIDQTLDMGIIGFGLSPNSLNIMSMMPTAQTVQVSSQCKTNQIFDVDGKCVDCTLNCRMCFEEVTNCKLCINAFYLSDANKCQKCLDLCKDCLDGTTCSTCKDPFILNPKKQCGCPEGKYVDLNTCSSCFQNCTSCTSNTTCSSCIQGYYAQDNTCKVCAEGCLVCTGLKSCSSCIRGYFIESNTCKGCAENCLVCTGLKSCATCAEDYELQNGVCEKNEGVPIWVIVLIIIVCVAIAAGILGAVLIKIRKERNLRQKTLLTDSDEGSGVLK